MEEVPGTVFHFNEVHAETELAKLTYDHNIVSVGKKEAMKLGVIFSKNSPLKPMFDQVNVISYKVIAEM